LLAVVVFTSTPTSTDWKQASVSSSQNSRQT
jgi:hypothetical protein